MREEFFLVPLVAQALLTLFLYAALGVAKSRAAKAGLVKLERRALYDDAWPENVMKINNNIRNQFELPVLFYVLGLLLWQLGETGPVALALSCLFVLSRVVHAYIHTGSNYVPARRAAFTVGWLLLVVMSALVIWRLIAS